MPQNMIELKDVSFSYVPGETIFHSVDLEIRKRDLIVIRGESGAGKSTFLKLFNRLCDSPAGRIFFHGKELQEYKIELLRSSVIYLPQLPCLIDGTVKDNLEFPFSFHSHKNKKFNTAKAEEWLDYFQLDLSLTHDSRKLSIGQKQRIALIRAMLLCPEVLLLDEPGSALDGKNKRLLEQKIEHLIDSSSVTVLMATHSEVNFSDVHYRALCLKDGMLLEEDHQGRHEH